MCVPLKVPPPAWANHAGARGSRGAGYTYERKVEQRLAALAADLGWELWAHQWFQCGGQLAQPDFILRSPSCALVIETKLTYVETRTQLTKYVNWLALMSIPAVPLTICRNLTPEVPQDILVYDLDSIFPYSVLHWWM